MEGNNHTEGTNEEELCSLPEMIYALCSKDRSDLNPLQEIFGAHTSSPMPKDVVTKNCDHDEKLDEESNRMAKRQRSMDYRVMMEKKRRQVIKDKIDTLQKMTPIPPKPDLAGKLENIIDYIKSLQYQADIMYRAYAATPVYSSPYYGTQPPPCMSPWGYYPPGIPMMPQQNMPYIPQYDQVYDMAPRDQTKP
ncbi:hypothetical protein CARUB_v10021430mg [Capsella rubella]|uniref:BHLH domain-containing protein n=1 Tax=Capsella rubella TaxID=81985 RepID=R0GE80_9BRAS|nr:transcription factor bHLH109 [Capsella rubella]EOA33936.1 hypothetical protein CARUB_v10021430mg [Capsella rubella]